MFLATLDLVLSADDRQTLLAMLRATTLAAGVARRARVMLAVADGHSYAQICAAHGVTDRYIARWKRRVADGGILALGDLPRAGRQDHRLPLAVEAKILARTQQPPPAPYTHWTTRRRATLMGVSHATVHRVWQRAGLQPHWLERYLTSDDPDFEAKTADVIGLYLKPPTNAVVFSVDEKSHIHALTGSTPCSRSRRGGRSGTASSTSATARSRFTPRSTWRRGASRG
jgi:transposase